MLIAAALHFSFDRRAVAIRMIKHLLIHLLTFRYYSAALVVRGINDFLAGPEILERDPALLHASLEPLRTKYTPTTASRLIVLAPEPVRPLPGRRVGYAMALAGAVLRNWMARTRRVSPRRINIRDFAWITLTRADHVALDTGWDLELPTLHRSRESFREISLSGAEAVSGLYKKAPVLAREWRKAAARLTSEPFWRSYLGLPAPATETPRVQMQRETAEPAIGE